MQPTDIEAIRQAFELVSTFTEAKLPQYTVNTEAEALQLATHRNYKGGLYRRVFESRHSENEEVLTVYVHIWPHQVGGWTRPAEMFHGRLEDERLRFAPLDR